MLNTDEKYKENNDFLCRNHAKITVQRLQTDEYVEIVCSVGILFDRSRTAYLNQNVSSESKNNILYF